MVDSLATSNIALHELLIPMPVVESLSMIDTVPVGSTQPINTKMLIMIDISLVPLIFPIKKIVTLVLPHRGL